MRGIEARTWITFHHIGVIDDRAAFLARLDRYAAVIRDREDRLLAYLAEPHTIAEVAAHRFVYRPGGAHGAVGVCSLRRGTAPVASTSPVRGLSPIG